MKKYNNSVNWANFHFLLRLKPKTEVNKRKHTTYHDATES